ncbi:MAG: hypothetical protein PHC43_09395, partial [Candidatus Marinimicrobia bacterium]|nr:hypothetical protein [Candidatus Neomarinimicrobiota bacterium]
MSSDWVPVLDANWETYQDAGDLPQTYLDMVTDADGSVGYYWSSTTSLFFRMTLRSTPVRTQGDLFQSGWFVALDVNRDGFLD